MNNIKKLIRIFNLKRNDYQLINNRSAILLFCKIQCPECNNLINKLHSTYNVYSSRPYYYLLSCDKNHSYFELYHYHYHNNDIFIVNFNFIIKAELRGKIQLENIKRLKSSFYIWNLKGQTIFATDRIPDKIFHKGEINKLLLLI